MWRHTHTQASHEMHIHTSISTVYRFSDASMEADCCQFQADDPGTHVNHPKEVRHARTH